MSELYYYTRELSKGIQPVEVEGGIKKLVNGKTRNGRIYSKYLFRDYGDAVTAFNAALDERIKSHEAAAEKYRQKKITV